MADETKAETTDSKPIAPQGSVFFTAPQSTVLLGDEIDVRPGAVNRSAPEPLPAAARLRAFEDEHFPDAVRIRDQIEKGSGSPFQMAKPEVRVQHAALEKLIEAEAKLAATHTALIAADTEYEAARAATEPKPDAASSE